jgi:hypothetical protein
MLQRGVSNIDVQLITGIDLMVTTSRQLNFRPLLLDFKRALDLIGLRAGIIVHGPLFLLPLMLPFLGRLLLTNCMFDGILCNYISDLAVLLLL